MDDPGEQALYHSIAVLATLLLQIGDVGKQFYLKVRLLHNMVTEYTLTFIPTIIINNSTVYVSVTLIISQLFPFCDCCILLSRVVPVKQVV